jgi:alpha-amylase/alpha-mannosidase (GH57 family)
MSKKYICIHGHFYQPPRENPWLESIEVQDSARPYHDWNERITLECYAPNAASRILDGEGRIAEIVDNYAHISFNFGPTLLTWMEREMPDVYRRIVKADKDSAAARGGHGNAMAQVYNHVIMPLANARDKVTQAVWGVRDFQKRFGRAPEGMWLAETAADSDSLEVLASLGIKFTVLAPSQAARVRPAGSRENNWVDVSGARVDPSRPYLWTSKSGHSLAVFFYDGPISRAVAFEGLLNNGEYFAGRLMKGFAPDRSGAQLVHAATDGESYGHHHRFGDMALAYALRKIQKEGLAELTNYGQFLEAHPPEWEVEIHENSSWSCFHGVERWRSDCGCRIGNYPSQQWRGPLRQALDELRDAADRLYEERSADLLKDPWRARNDYIDVVSDRGDEALNRFFGAHQTRPLSEPERVAALKLLEMQRHRLFMYTSCGWFFDDISGIESGIILAAAARTIQLAQSFPGSAGLEEAFVARLAEARGNVPEYPDGAAVYRRLVKPQTTDLPRAAAHQAVQGLFEETPPAGSLYAFRYELLDRTLESSGAATLSAGRLRIASGVTREADEFFFALLHLGGHDFRGALKPLRDGFNADALRNRLVQDLKSGSVPELAPLFGDGARTFGLQDLFLDDRRRILRAVIRDVLGRYDGEYRRLVEENRGLANYLAEAGFPMPEAFLLAIRYVLDQDLERLTEGLRGAPEETDRLVRLQEEAKKFAVPVDFGPLAEAVRKRIEALVEALAAQPDPAKARQALQFLNLADRLRLKPYLWRAETLYYELWNARLRNPKDAGMDEAAHWPFRELAERFKFKTPVPA